MTEFKYQIGDHVVPRVVAEAMLFEMAQTTTRRTPEGYEIIERISVECVGGTQLFYGCQRWDGNLGIYAEVSLVMQDTVFTQWLDQFRASVKKAAQEPL